jgi:hypothetical protein
MIQQAHLGPPSEHRNFTRIRACLDQRNFIGNSWESIPLERFLEMLFGMKETLTVKQRKVSYLHSFHGKQNI